MVVDGAVEEVEDVSTKNGGKGHYTPVLAQAWDTEFMRDQRRENTE